MKKSVAQGLSVWVPCNLGAGGNDGKKVFFKFKVSGAQEKTKKSLKQEMSEKASSW